MSRGPTQLLIISRDLKAVLNQSPGVEYNCDYVYRGKKKRKKKEFR